MRPYAGAETVTTCLLTRANQSDVAAPTASQATRSDTDPCLSCRYNVGMRAFFEGGHCGDVHVVDVFNMTHVLVTELPAEEALPLTYDSVHWAEVRGLVWAQPCLALSKIPSHVGTRERLLDSCDQMRSHDRSLPQP